ncbi:MAG: hypothetical protein KC619_13400 [Myxococcales bacterium]|nr:hypothetical protein [Myxococcales bacterium]
MQRLLLAGLLVGCGATAPAETTPPPREEVSRPPAADVAAERFAAGEQAAEAGDLEGAERHLRAALAAPGLAPDDELAWRIRAGLAQVLSRAGERQAARETAGFLCGGLDPGMAPPYFAALVARLEEAQVCGGACARLSPCCHAFISAMTSSTGTTLDADETCRGVDELRSDQLTEEVCTQILDGWRQALTTLPGATIPDECG